MKAHLVALAITVFSCGANAGSFGSNLGAMISVKGGDGAGLEAIIDINNASSSRAGGVALGATTFDNTNKLYGGFGFRSYESEKDNGFAGSLGLYLSKTENEELNYDRTGIEVSGSILYELEKGVFFGVGGSFSPEFLSTDWNSPMFAEYSYSFIGEYFVADGLSIFGEFESINYLNDDLNNINLDNSATAGVRFKF